MLHFVQTFINTVLCDKIGCTDTQGDLHQCLEL
jgi:hypothetical protein